MYQINIDVIKDIDVNELGLAELYAFEDMIHSLAIATKNHWIEVADQKLRSSKTEYIRGLQENNSLRKVGSMSYEVALVGWLPNAIEGGIPRFDMKPGLLHGKHAKMGKNGPYNTVPFRHFTGAKSVERISKIKNYANDLNKIVKAYGLDKVKKTSTGIPLQGAVGKATGVEKLVQKLNPRHKSPIFEGLTQYQKTYKKATQSQLLTFRRVSSQSDPGSWIHPGIHAASIMPTVADWVQLQSNLIFQNVLGGK